MKEAVELIRSIVGKENVLVGEGINEDYSHDEALSVTPRMPEALVKPGSAEDIAGILRIANKEKIPITPRGAGTGLSGGCVPVSGGILLSLERMNRILEIDEANHVAIVEPGVILADLYREVESRGLYYPLYPGEISATIGGNVSTNAGGMRAVKYGVTRHFVLGLEAVLPTGEIILTGGRYVKVSTGYDLTQLLVGSEGSLAVITKVILKLLSKPEVTKALLVPFKELNNAIRTVPLLFRSGVTPVTIEFIEKLGLMGMENYTGKKVPLDEGVRNEAEAYLIIVVEAKNSDEALADAEILGDVCMKHGAIDIFIPPSEKGRRELMELREKAFFAAKEAGATDQLDVVVPRGVIPDFVKQVHEIAAKYSTLIASGGHAGDGNVHFALFEQDAGRRHSIIREIYKAGKDLGGNISAEHGIGSEKRKYLLEIEDKTKIEIMRGIKKVFDPNNIMNPGKIF